MRPLNKKTILKDTVKGQYTRGKSNGVQVNSYLEDIEKYESKTETFVAIKTYVDNWRWKNVPFYLRTGKRMIKRYSEIVINFKEVLTAPHILSVTLGNQDAEDYLLLNAREFVASTGSACSSGLVQRSHVLQACLGRISNSKQIRISF